jgi:hypothetical protein
MLFLWQLGYRFWRSMKIVSKNSQNLASVLII